MPIAFCGTSSASFGFFSFYTLMMLFTSKYLAFALLTLSAAPTTLAALNGRCNLADGTAGVCIHTADCSGGGGTSTSGFCPNDPADVKCCTKNCSGGGGSGSCKWASTCTGTTLSGLCPGPTDFKCCITSSSGGGGNHQLSENGARFIANFEGFRANFYNDAAVSRPALCMCADALCAC